MSVIKLPFKDYKAIYSKVPRLCVDLVIKDSTGLLLTLRDIEPRKGFWHLPGGTVLYGESLESAVERIAKEELGIDVNIQKFLGSIEFLNNPKIAEHAVSLVYLVKPVTKDIMLNHQASKFDFFKLLPKNTVAEHKNFLLASCLL
ncbi:NUDIX domain-containing protein [Candidatus Daviesbacteria bacterium]|nr:NUDIX domain-containing protein [Candidatus Daviesbacteria bacterium]